MTLCDIHIPVGCCDGKAVGFLLGYFVGFGDGFLDGLNEGFLVGRFVGLEDGLRVGRNVNNGMFGGLEEFLAFRSTLCRSSVIFALKKKLLQGSIIVEITTMAI